MKTALFSVSYAGLWGQCCLELPHFINHAKALGYQAVMLMGKRPHASILNLDAARRLDLRARLQAARARNGLPRRLYQFHREPRIPRGSPFLELQVRYIEELARLAANLDCALVRVFTGYELPGHSPGALWERCVKGLRWCADVARPFGVTLGIQNHHDVALQTEALLKLLREIARPNVKLMFDAWSPALRGEDLYQAAKQAAPFTVATTCADYVRLPRFAYVPDCVNYRRLKPDLVRAVPMGEGFIDYASFLRGLREGGFDGWINYEMCSPLRGGGDKTNLDAAARHFLDYLRRLGCEV